MASILGEAFKFARGGLNRDNQADAGTSSRIAPKKKFFDFGAAIDATEFGQQHRMAEASRASTEASTRSSDAFAVFRTSEAEKNRQDILDKNEPIDLNKVLGVSFTPTRTKGIIDFMKINGADIDGNNIITPQEGSKFLSTLQKNHPNFIKEQLTGASKDAQTQMEDIQITMFGTPEGKKLNAQFPDITTDNIEQAFQDRPILTQTFPKLGEQVRQLSALRQRKEGFGELQKNLGTTAIPNLGDDFERAAFGLGVDPRNPNLYKPEKKDIIAQINERVKEGSDITLKNEKLRLMGMKTGLILEEDRNVINARIKEIDKILSKGQRGQQQLTVIEERVHAKSGKTIVKLSDGNVVEKLVVNGITIYKDSNGNDITDVVGE